MLDEDEDFIGLKHTSLFPKKSFEINIVVGRLNAQKVNVYK
jgi:hypothetical protein